MTKETRFTIKNGDKELDLFIKPPSQKVNSEASRVYNKVFKECLLDGCILRDVLDKALRKAGLWSDDHETQYIDLAKKIAKMDNCLNTGKEDGEKLKISRAKEIAIELREARAELQLLLIDRNRYDQNTVESSADDAKFNYLLSACVYDHVTQKPYFPSYEAYLENASHDLSFQIASKFANYMYGLNENFESELTENKFLRRFKFCDEAGRLIDEDGNLVDSQGRRIDEDGNLLNNDGKRIDINGNEIDESLNVDTVEFEDDLSGPVKRKRATKKE